MWSIQQASSCVVLTKPCEYIEAAKLYSDICQIIPLYTEDIELVI